MLHWDYMRCCLSDWYILVISQVVKCPIGNKEYSDPLLTLSSCSPTESLPEITDVLGKREAPLKNKLNIRYVHTHTKCSHCNQDMNYWLLLLELSVDPILVELWHLRCIYFYCLMSKWARISFLDKPFLKTVCYSSNLNSPINKNDSFRNGLRSQSFWCCSVMCRSRISRRAWSIW